MYFSEISVECVCSHNVISFRLPAGSHDVSPLVAGVRRQGYGTCRL